MLEEFSDKLRGSLAGAGAAQRGDDFTEPGLDLIATRVVAEQFEDSARNVFTGGGILDKLGKKRLPCEQIGHREGVHLDEAFADLVGEPRGLVESHSRHAEPGAFHGDRAG